MAVSIDNYLRTLSYERYYLKNNSTETEKINRSIAALIQNLKTEFVYQVKEVLVFGSYDRDTILPRSTDEKSDIDILVIFNHTEYERTPETYRTWLKNFADKYYQSRYGSSVVKSFPTVTLSLNNINFDLVPAKREIDFLFGESIFIPSGNSNWQKTNPKDVKEKLTTANTKYNSVVKPIIRILKAWNANSGYPYDSYELELQLTEMNFSNDNFQTGLFYAAEKLTVNWNDPAAKHEKVKSLRFNLGKAQESLNGDDLVRAKSWLSRILP